jgi:hypothetical protein
LRLHTRERREKGLPQILNVECRRQLVGESRHERDLLRPVGAPFVMVQLHEPDRAVAEPERHHGHTHRARPDPFGASIARGV